MYGYDNKYDGLNCYHSAFALEGDSDKLFTQHHWMIDSGCIDHLSPFKDDFAHLGNQVRHAIVANGQKVPMYGPGKIIIQSKDLQAEPLVLSEVLYAPHVGHRLLSVPTLTSQGYKCMINDHKSNIWDANKRLVIQAKALSEQYIMLDTRPDIAFTLSKFRSSLPIQQKNIYKRRSILYTIYHSFQIFASCILDMVTRTVYMLILIQTGLVMLKHHVPPLVMPSS